jgi:hypothetical protein
MAQQRDYIGATREMIVNAFQTETYVKNRMDVQHTPLYDTVTFAASAVVSETSGLFFQNVGAGSNKNQGQTNLDRPGELIAPEAFSIYSIRFKWQENILAADIYQLFNNLAFQFFIGKKDYQLAPIWYFAAGAGIYSVTNVTAASFYTNGIPSRESIHKLAIPLVLENGVNFKAVLTGNAVTLTAGASGGTGAIFQAMLDGLYARGVQ